MAAQPRVVPLLAALAAAFAAGSLPAAEPTPKPAIRTTSVRPTNPLEALQAQARAAKAPGGSPESESAALLSKLSRTHTRNLESDNARVKARFAAASPLAVGPAGRGAIGGASGPGAASAASAKPQQGIAPDPCGSTFDLKAIATSPPLDPGEAVLLEGCGFGTSLTGGEVRLVGDFPGGFLKLKVDSWTPHKILVYVPDVSGVPDVPTAKIQVFRKDGKFSNWLDVGFRATRVVQRIPPSAVAVNCAPAYAQQDCTLAASHPLSETSFYGGATFAAKHTSSSTIALDCEDSANLLVALRREGTDVAAVSLKNGWLLAGYAWWWTEAGAGYAVAPSGFMQDTASSSIGMQWAAYSAWCNGPRTSVTRYRVDLYAYGPKGVPFK